MATVELMKSIKAIFGALSSYWLKTMSCYASLTKNDAFVSYFCLIYEVAIKTLKIT